MLKQVVSRIVVAGVLVSSLTGCGASYSSYGHRHRGGEGVAIVAGLMIGAAIAASSHSHSEPAPEPVYYSRNVYPPPPPLPPSPRDVVRVNEAESPPFDPQAARAVFNNIDVSACRAAGAPSGFGHAKVTMNPDGRVSKVIVDEPAGMSAEAAKCVGDRIGTATVAPFKGSLVTMGTTFHVRRDN